VPAREHFGTNYPHLNGAAYNELKYTDEAQRKDAYAKAQEVIEVIMDDAPNLFLCAPTYFGAIHDNL